MKKILALVVLAALLALGGFYLLKNKGNEIQFKTARVSRGDIRATVTATGTVSAVTTVQVGTQVSGTIKEIFVDFNSSVKKGQLLARIDPALSEAKVLQARANLQAAQANVDKVEASLLDANRTLERNKTLFAKNFIARSDLDTAETNRLAAEAQLKVAKAQLEQQKAALNQEETNLNYTRILSPVDGTVISRNVDIGQTVAASFQTPTLFSIAEDLTRMQIDTSVDEADIGRVKVGQSVEFNVDAYPDAVFPGRVSEIRNAPTTVQNVVTYDVMVKVSNPELKLKPGMTANVSIITAMEKAVLKIPNAALRFKWQPAGRTSGRGGDGGATAVAAAGAGGTQTERAPAGERGSGAGRTQGERMAGSGRSLEGGAAVGDGAPQRQRPAGSDGQQAERWSGGGSSGRPQGERGTGGGRHLQGEFSGSGAGRQPGERAAGADRRLQGERAAGFEGRPQAQGERPSGVTGGMGAGERPARQQTQRAPEGAKRQDVWVLDGQTPRRVSLTLGISDGSNTAVLAGGIREGDALITDATGDTKRGSSAMPGAGGRPPGGGGFFR